MMYASIGDKHPGFDCFIYKRDLYPNFELGNTILGANWIGRVLLANIVAYASKYKIFENEHLTFHIGDDRSWQNPQNNQFHEKNRSELLKILDSFDIKNLCQERISVLTEIRNDLSPKKYVVNNDKASWPTYIKILHKVKSIIRDPLLYWSKRKYYKKS